MYNFIKPTLISDNCDGYQFAKGPFSRLLDGIIGYGPKVIICLPGLKRKKRTKSEGNLIPLLMLYLFDIVPQIDKKALKEKDGSNDGTPEEQISLVKNPSDPNV